MRERLRSPSVCSPPLIQGRRARLAALLVAAGALVAGLAVGSTPAPAAFPGLNGKIAFESERSGNDDIFVMNGDGSGQVNRSNNAMDDRPPAWSADGTKIAFASNRDGNLEIYVMNA